MAERPDELTVNGGAIKRIRLEVEGIVQGVGFRPFTYRLASRFHLAGWVRNTPRGVELEVEGTPDAVDHFIRAIVDEAPPLALITALRSHDAAVCGQSGFVIAASGAGDNQAWISPDCDVCPDCLRELFDPADRRYRYPFINCTNCGPRYSIITGIPYDRPFTSMADFVLCPRCRAEYGDPSSRRFHAQPNACPECGPRLSLLDPAGGAVDGDPLENAVRLLREGRIVAVKGTGGYHLAVDASSCAAVRELRLRKKRDEKPFAVMAADMETVHALAWCDGIAQRLLEGPERPIVLLGKRDGAPIAPEVAPLNGYVGIMLPSTPLQHLLLRDNFPALVMTSGNLSDEPIARDNEEAVVRLAGIADFFLVHNRRIEARIDDSVIRVFQGGPLFLRRSRGYVPRGIPLSMSQESVLAVGAELKAAVCLTRGNTAFPSQHIGDLQNAATMLFLEDAVAHLRRVLHIEPKMVAHDLHPDYLSTAFAATLDGIPSVAVQHHHAHMAACMAENRVEGPAIGVILDGTGLGDDGTIWGGEFLVGDCRSVRRAAHFRQVPLPGGDAAVREPSRMAVAYCLQALGEEGLSLPLAPLQHLKANDKRLLVRMMERNINSPLTSSCGRLFDAVASLLGVRQRVTYEGQAAMELEALAELGEPTWNFPYAIVRRGERHILDFSLTIAALVKDVLAGEGPAVLARRFHETLAAATVDMCRKLREETGIEQVVMSGGVFQNRLLSEKLFMELVASGFRAYAHRLVPTNDGGIALGQAVIAGHRSASSFAQSRR